ncbi:MAG: hypothetical protein U9N37_07150, partial [Thermodesulfobacteriota bacterium]|nr:hypothetical protein [Thermodesulfobacteriota bacterium]
MKSGKVISGTGGSFHRNTHRDKDIQMNGNFKEKKQCNACGSAVVTYDGVYISKGDNSRFLCSKCYNESISKAIGLNFDHLSFHPIILADKDNENHTFHI